MPAQVREISVFMKFTVASVAGPINSFTVIVGSDLLDRLAKRSVKRRLGRNLDDVSAFDRFVRCLGGRRNIYIWLFGLGLAVGVSRSAFVPLCLWGAATAAVHVVRGLQIGFGRSERIPDHSRHTPRA